MQKIKIDPEFKALIPPQTEDEHSGLKESLLKYGCRDALVLWGDILIDGHNRYEICTEHNIPFRTEKVRGVEDRNDAIVWIIKNQLSRRNLQKFQGSELALRMEEAVAAKAKARQATSTGGATPQLLQKSEKAEPVHTDEALARMAGVSRDTIQKTRTILKEGTEEQKQRARAGGKGNTVNAVYREVVGKEIKRRVCSMCGQEFSETAFLKNSDVCCKCRHTHNDAETREIMAHVDAAVESLYDQGREIVYTVDDLEEEVNTMVGNFVGQIRRVFDIRSCVLEEKGAKEKMTAALSEAEAAIGMLRGSLI